MFQQRKDNHSLARPSRLTSQGKIDNRRSGEFTFFTGACHIISPVLSTDFPQPMKLKSEQIERLADLILTSCQTKEFIVLKAAQPKVRAKITAIIAKNFSEEEEIEQEARKMLASHAGEVREMDPYRMFLLIKQKLAEKRGFVL